jgi:hypothetical protein
MDAEDLLRQAADPAGSGGSRSDEDPPPVEGS